MDAERADAPIDRYVVLEYLAEGGMGAIYLGKKLGAGGFEKHVVLKQLLPEFTRQPEFIDLFLREARLSATLDHANIIHTIDLVTAGEEHFIVMEYLDGADLRTLLKKAKRRKRLFSAAAGIFVARELLSALAYAHTKMGEDGRPLELIHRDISPSNILISGNGEVKLTDFGIAKASTHNSIFYRVKGKIGYMSPEQARSEPLDARSDLYSLAVCLYETITGERLFVDAGLTVSAEEMYGQPIPLLSRKVPGLPADLDKVMLKALSIDPAHRYQTAGAFQDALMRCAHRHDLVLSGADLAEHLRWVCGDPSGWREIDDRPSSASPGTRGTEIYDRVESTEQISADEVEEDLLQLAEAGSLLDQGRRRRERAKTSITHLTELKGIQLTSVMNLASSDHLGSEPLVDLHAESEKLLTESGLTPLSEGGDPPGEPTVPRPPRAPVIEARRTRGDASGPPATLATLHDPDSPRAPEPVERPRPLVAERRSRGPWIAILVFVLLGAAALLGIGLSGPTLDIDEAARLPGAQAP